MGIGNFLKRGVKELMIARPDEAKDFAIYKHPDQTIPTMAQLTVDSDEVAVFFKDGKVVGKLAPGRHTPRSENIPFLSNLVDSFTGGNVFIAEVFFVSVRQFPNLKFGGRIGSVEDPKSGVPVETMVHGDFALQIINPEALIIGLVGMRQADNESFFKWFKQQVLKVIRDQTAELIDHEAERASPDKSSRHATATTRSALAFRHSSSREAISSAERSSQATVARFVWVLRPMLYDHSTVRPSPVTDLSVPFCVPRVVPMRTSAPPSFS